MTGWNYPPGVTGNEDYFQDGPAVTILKERSVKRTRFEHKCWMCGSPIKAGSPAYYVAFIDYDNGGKFCSSYQHPMICPWEVGHP